MAHSILIALLVVISALTKTRIFALHFSSKTINYRATKYNKCNGHHQLSRLFSSSDTDKVDINQSQESIPVSPQRPQDPYRSSMPLSVITEPLKVMIFLDGTWAYYSTIVGREDCPIRNHFGDRWLLSHRLDWRKLPQIIASSLNEQVKYLYGIDRKVDIVRTSVFTSMRDDTKQESYRNKMVTDFYSSNFDVHQFVTSGHAEKCVDISLAVEMLFMATVPNAYDIAVIVTGDKDFMPALRKTREKGKRVAICSMRNSCNKQLVRPDSGIRDFELIWIEDSLEDIIVPFEADGMDEVIINVLVREIQSSERQELGSRNAGLALKYTLIGGINTNKILKERYTSLRSFIDRYSQFFHSTSHEDSPTEFKINLVKNAPLNKLPPLPSNVRLSRLSSSDQMTDGDSDLSEEEDSDESHSTKSIDGLDSDDDTALRASKTGADYDDDDVDRVLSDLNHSDDDESSTRTSLSADEPMLEMLPPFVSKSREDLTNLLKADLQQLLKDNSLKVTGGKPELVDRYLEWQETERLKWEAEKTRIEELQIARLEEADLRRMRQADETRFRDNTSESPFIPRSWSSGTRSPNRNTGVGGVGAGIRTPLGGSRFAPQQLQGRVQATSGRAQFQPYQSVGHGSSLSNGFNNYRGSGTTDLNVSRPPPPTYTTFITPAGSYTATSGSASSTGGAMLDSSVTAGIEPQTVAVMNVVKRFMDKQGLEVVPSRELGRHLASNIFKDAATGQSQSSLQYVKSRYNTLLSFVRKYRRVFEAPQPLPAEVQDPNHPGEFGVAFVKPPTKTPYPPSSSTSESIVPE